MNNPFEQKFETRFGAVPFGAIRNEHYMPAIREAIGKALDEIDAITSNPEKPTFDNNAVKLIQKNKQNQWFDWLMIKYKLIN